MRFAYADPPYYKQGKKHYDKHHPDAVVWDEKAAHFDLVKKLVEEYPDGWALSCNTKDLQWLLPACPEDIRVCAWVKNFHQIRAIPVQHAWEAVILWRGRKQNKRNPMVRDWYLGVPTRMKGLPGAKSDKFNDWILSLLNYQDGDILDDLFPGTGGMAKATERLTLWNK